MRAFVALLICIPDISVFSLYHVQPFHPLQIRGGEVIVDAEQVEDTLPLC